MNKEAIKLYKTKYPVIKVLFSDGKTKRYDLINIINKYDLI